MWDRTEIKRRFYHVPEQGVNRAFTRSTLSQ